MELVIAYTILTIISVVFTIRKGKIAYMTLPFIAIFAYMLIKVWMVPLPFWETVQFIIGLK